MKIRYAATAAIELEEALAYLRKQSPRTVRRFRQYVREAERRLRELPALGQPMSTEPLPIRRVLLRPYPYLLFYQATGTEVLIVGIRHGARDPASMPDRDDSDR